MHRLLLTTAVLVAFAGSASAQTTQSVIIPVTGGKTVASGYRDIPPGQFFFQLTIQSNSGTIYGAGATSSNGQVTWVPQGPIVNVTTVTFVTSTALTESQVGTVSGSAIMMQNGPPVSGYFYTTNVFWTDVYNNSGLYPGGPYYDPAVPLPFTDPISLPSSTSASTSSGISTSLTVQGTGSGTMWFTSTDSSAAIYRLDQGSGEWVKADQPFPLTLPASGLQLAMRAADVFVLGRSTQFMVYYASNDSFNGMAGDTLDILNAFGDNPQNLSD